MTADNRNTGLVHIYCGDGKVRQLQLWGLPQELPEAVRKFL